MAFLNSRDNALTRYSHAISLALFPALFLAALEGHPYQGDMHMVFFAYLAISAAWTDEGSILIAAGVIAIHHLVLNFIAPALVFAGGADLPRVILHAVVVIAQTISLTYGVFRLKSLLLAQETLQTKTAEALAEKEHLAVEHLKAVQSVDAHRQTLVEAIQGFESAIAGRLHAVEGEAASTRQTAERLQAKPRRRCATRWMPPAWPCNHARTSVRSPP